MTAADQARSGIEATGSVVAREHFAGFESLRALAAVMVVVHHASSLAGPSSTARFATLASVMDGGVAVFFVLSGFLIYRPFAAAGLGLRSSPATLAFWWRRLLRIVPAYWLALTFFWGIGSFHLGAQWWRYYLFLQIYDRYTTLGGIVQAWSLCTEISFYLLVPVWAALVARAARGRSLRARTVVEMSGCGALWLAGVGSRIAIEQWAPGQRGLAFNWLPTNLDLFATGMAVSVVSVWASQNAPARRRLDSIARSVWPWWLAAAVLFAWYAYRVGPADFATGYSGWFWQRRQIVLGVFTALLIVPAVFGNQRPIGLRRVWSWTPVVWVGTVSYGLYLWHLDWMERAIAGPQWEGWIGGNPGNASFARLVVIGLIAGLVFAALSWYLLEKPLQRWKDLFRRGRVVGRTSGDPEPAG